MGRIVKKKELINTRLAANYGGWMYCTNCNKNIGYLCYVTYDELDFHYQCQCGSKGSANIEFEDSKQGMQCDEDMILIKNRLCCSKDEAPLITVLSKNVKDYKLNITCKSCGRKYTQIGE